MFLKISLKRSLLLALLVICILGIVSVQFKTEHFTRFIDRPIGLARVYHKDQFSKFAVLQKTSANTDDLPTSKIDEFQFNAPKSLVDPNQLTLEGYQIIYIEEYDYTNITNLIVDNIRDQKQESAMVQLQYEDEFKTSFVKFFQNLFDVIAEANPTVPPINNDDHYRLARQENRYSNRDGRVPVYGGHLRENYLNEDVRTMEMLASFLRLDSKEIQSLKQSHSSFMLNMPDNFPPNLYKFSKYNEFMKGDGIVYLGGDDYNQLALLSIKMLRSAGSKLPVELIVPNDSDYDVDLCDRILPALNGRCKVMADYLPREFVKEIKGYMMKNVALLISSFKNVLYLDADNIPIQNPDSLFVNPPFTNNHLIIWPDLWRRSTSPNYYKIADINTYPQERIRESYFLDDKRKDAPEISYHDCKGTIPEASSETGQLLINKEVHIKTLILSMYYNFLGKDYYYPLFSQGAAGEGDKETFIAAAHKLDLPYYQVKEFTREFGPMNDQNRHELFGMGQYDPLIDYFQDINKDFLLQTDPKAVDYAANSDDKEHLNYNFHYFKSSSLMFLHANWPKYKVAEMFIHNSHNRGPKKDNKRRRLYDWNIIGEANGLDVESCIMTSLKWLFCELNIDLKKVPEIGLEDRQKICKEINEHVKFLTTSTST